jgi:hypothetical protein
VQASSFPPEEHLIDIGNCYLSCRKIQSALGWQPRTSLRVGLANMIEFYRKNLAHYLEPNVDRIPGPDATISRS